MSNEANVNSYEVKKGHDKAAIKDIVASSRNKTIINTEQVFTSAVLEDMIRAKNIAEEESKIFRDRDAGIIRHDADAVIKWIKKDNKITATATVKSADFTTVNYRETSVKAPDILYILGLKIDLKSKRDVYIDNYKKNYVLSRSHNLLLAKFAQLKLGFYGMMLALVGVNANELREMQKDARRGALAQNRVLFEENEYAGELLAIMGGDKKRVKAQNIVINEVRKQITSQCDHFGQKDFYDKKMISEIQVAQCTKIIDGLKDEREALVYKMSMIDLGIAEDESLSDTKEKLNKINGLIARAQSRLLLREAELAKLSGISEDKSKKV